MSSVCRLIRDGRGRDGLTMPLLRYFLFVGGSLLALLLVANAALPAASAPEGLSSGADLPPIRILSERKLPERVVIDTSVAMPAQTPAAPVVVAQAQAPVAPATAEMSAEARVSDMATVVVPEPRMYPARPPIK